MSISHPVCIYPVKISAPEDTIQTNQCYFIRINHKLDYLRYNYCKNPD